MNTLTKCISGEILVLQEHPTVRQKQRLKDTRRSRCPRQSLIICHMLDADLQGNQICSDCKSDCPGQAMWWPVLTHTYTICDPSKTQDFGSSLFLSVSEIITRCFGDIKPTILIS